MDDGDTRHREAGCMTKLGQETRSRPAPDCEMRRREKESAGNKRERKILTANLSSKEILNQHEE